LSPSQAPSQASEVPSMAPSVMPTAVPSQEPSLNPSQPPSMVPSPKPTASPTSYPTPMPTHAPTLETAAATSFGLMSAVNDNRLVEVKDGDTIDLAVWGDKLNLRAEFNGDGSESSPQADSVDFLVNGVFLRKEKYPPYALGSNNGPDNNSYVVTGILATPTNSVTIEAVPYWKGMAGPSYKVTIAIVGI